MTDIIRANIQRVSHLEHPKDPGGYADGWRSLVCNYGRRFGVLEHGPTGCHGPGWCTGIFRDSGDHRYRVHDPGAR